MNELLSQASLHVFILSRLTNLPTVNGHGPPAQVYPHSTKSQFWQASTYPGVGGSCFPTLLRVAPIQPGAVSILLGSWCSFVCTSQEQDSQAEGLGQLEDPWLLCLCFHLRVMGLATQALFVSSPGQELCCPVLWCLPVSVTEPYTHSLVPADGP